MSAAPPQPVEIDDRELVDLAAELVRIPSHPGVPRQEEGVARALAGYLGRHGIAAELVEVLPGRPNLLAAVAGRRPGRRLLLCGHTDTVPLNADDPGSGFSGEVRDGILHGRGAVDMKGAMAAMAAALVALRRAGAPVAGEVTLAAVVDEEMAGLGIEHLIASGVAADAAVVGEPTANRPCLGHKGLEWLEVELTGRAAHGGTPEKGINAIAAAARFIHLVESELAPRLAARAHPLLGPPTLNFGTVRGGDQPSTVASSCTLALDRRLVPGETFATVVAELTDLLDRVAAAMPGLETSVRRQVGGVAKLERRPFAVAPDHPLARALAGACRATAGGAATDAPPFGAFPAWTDGGLLAGHAGIPTLILGPGDLALAHSPREAVPIEELAAAARIYAAAALAFCPSEAA